MKLEEVFNLRNRLTELEKSLSSLSLIERCEAEDEILEIKEKLGEFKRQVENGGDECINCSG